MITPLVESVQTAEDIDIVESILHSVSETLRVQSKLIFDNTHYKDNPQMQSDLNFIRMQHQAIIGEITRMQIAVRSKK